MTVMSDVGFVLAHEQFTVLQIVGDKKDADAATSAAQIHN